MKRRVNTIINAFLCKVDLFLRSYSYLKILKSIMSLIVVNLGLNCPFKLIVYFGPKALIAFQSAEMTKRVLQVLKISFPNRFSRLEVLSLRFCFEQLNVTLSFNPIPLLTLLSDYGYVCLISIIKTPNLFPFS